MKAWRRRTSKARRTSPRSPRSWVSGVSSRSRRWRPGAAAPTDGSPAHEESPPQLPLPTRYCATKAAGEERVQHWAQQGLKVNTVFPSLVYGPPGKKQGANTLLRALMLGRFPALIGPEKKTSWVFLDDLVDGIVRVMDQAPPGRGYLLAGEAWTVRELAQRVAAFRRREAAEARILGRHRPPPLPRRRPAPQARRPAAADPARAVGVARPPLELRRHPRPHRARLAARAASKRGSPSPSTTCASRRRRSPLPDSRRRCARLGCRPLRKQVS